MSDSIESLQQKLEEATDPLARIDLLVALAEAMRRSKPEVALKHAIKALRLATSRKDSPRMAHSLMLAGSCESNLCRYEDALQRVGRAVQLSRETGDSTMVIRGLNMIAEISTSTGDYPKAIEALTDALEQAQAGSNSILLGGVVNSMGVAYFRIGDYTRALEYLQRSRKIAEEIGNQRLSMMTTCNLGNVYFLLGDLEKAHQQYVVAAELAIRVEDRISETGTLINLGSVADRAGNPQEALQYYSRALTLCRDTGSTAHEATTLAGIGELHLSQGAFDIAMGWMQQAYDITERIHHGLRWICLMHLGEIHLGLDDHDRALVTLDRALQGAMEYGDRDCEFHIHEILSRFHEVTGDTAKALEHHKLYTQIKEETTGKEQQRAMMQLQMRMEIERTEKEREIMRLEKQRLEQEMEYKSRELTAMALHLVEKNQFLDEVKREMSSVIETVEAKARPRVRGLVQQVERNINAKEDWEAFEVQFGNVHPDFLRKLSQRCPELTRMELKICALLKINLSSKEIADLLKASVRTVEWHRLKLRKKLDLDADANLAAYFASL